MVVQMHFTHEIVTSMTEMHTHMYTGTCTLLGNYFMVGHIPVHILYKFTMEFGDKGYQDFHTTLDHTNTWNSFDILTYYTFRKKEEAVRLKTKLRNHSFHIYLLEPHCARLFR